MDLENVATLLEKMAAYLEADNSAKVAAVEQHRTNTAMQVASQVVEVLGERLDSKMATDLSDNETALQLLEHMNKKVSELGGPAPSRRPKTAARPSIREEVAQASREFAEWALGD